MLSCMRPRNYRGEMLVLAIECQKIVGEMTDFLDDGNKPNAGTMRRGASLMAEKERLKARNGLVRDKVFRWTMGQYEKQRPRMVDFGKVLDCQTEIKFRREAAKRILDFFSAIWEQAFYYFEFPPDFDTLILREVLPALEKIGADPQKKRRSAVCVAVHPRPGRR